MNKKIILKIITPEKVILNKEVDFIILRTNEGEMGVLYDHEPFSAALGFSAVRAFVDNEQTDAFAIVGGFVTIRDNTVTIISVIVEEPDNLKDAVAHLEKERLENKKIERTVDLEVSQAQTTLRNELVKIDISSYSILKGK